MNFMTWVVGGNCFNGFICIADIQATITIPGKPNQYFNCVKKIHQVAKNLCVAFCGDIRTGLEIIQELERVISISMPEENYFDIDGYSKDIINLLQNHYLKLNPKNKPIVEFMFLWNAQEGNESEFRPFCMRFKSPKFNMNSTQRIGLAKFGSGNNNESYRAIAAFLSGEIQQTDAFQKVFPGQTEAAPMWTVQKFKTMLFHEATNISFPGVSKSFISYESVIGPADLFPQNTLQELTKTFKRLGVTYESVKTANHDFTKVTLDPTAVKKNFAKLCQDDIKLVLSIKSQLRESLESINPEAIHKLPEVKFDFINGEEHIDCKDLISTWREMHLFLKQKKININACQAIA